MTAPIDRNPSARTKRGLAIGAVAAVVGLGGPAVAFDIVFDYTYDDFGFFDASRRAVLDAAAGFFESTIQDDLAAIDSDADAGGFNSFNVNFLDPEAPTTGASAITINNYDVAADTLVVFVGSFNFSGSTLGQGGPGGFSAGGSSAFLDNAITRGETPTRDGVRNPDTDTQSAVDFAPWGGSISFDRDTDWYVDNDPSTDESFGGQHDFYSVALHELGHVLGMGTADSWDNQIAGGQFTGANAVAAHGGNVNLQSGGGHWASDTDSTIFGTSTAQEAAMDPSIQVGTRKRFTDLDMAGLEDIGWEIQPASAG